MRRDGGSLMVEMIVWLEGERLLLRGRRRLGSPWHSGSAPGFSISLDGTFLPIQSMVLFPVEHSIRTVGANELNLAHECASSCCQWRCKSGCPGHSSENLRDIYAMYLTLLTAYTAQCTVKAI